MKKILSKILAISLCASTFLMLNNVAFANDDAGNKEVIISEYDLYLNEKSYAKSISKDELTETDLYFLNNGIEKELLQRQTMDVDYLKKEYGYSDKQIDILMQYDGSPIEEMPEMRSLLSAELHIQSSDVIHANGTYGRCTINWNWTSMPLNTFTDVIAIASTGVDSHSVQIATRTNCYGTTKYYTTGNIYMSSADEVHSYTTSGTGSALNAKIKMRKALTTNTLYAKSGTVDVIVRPVTGSDLRVGFVDFVYGHTEMVVNNPTISITYPAGISFSLSLSTNVVERNRRRVEL